jgi:hypothetical protein
MRVMSYNTLFGGFDGPSDIRYRRWSRLSATSIQTS